MGDGNDYHQQRKKKDDWKPTRNVAKTAKEIDRAQNEEDGAQDRGKN